MSRARTCAPGSSGVERLNDAAAKVHKGLRIFVRDESPLASIESRLTTQGDGEVSLVVMLGPKEGEVEIRLPGRYSRQPRGRRRAEGRAGRGGGGTCVRRPGKPRRARRERLASALGLRY